MSKVFEPIEVLIPIEPNPCLVTITDEMASGIDVPAARNVNPIKLSVELKENNLSLMSH